MPTLCRGYGRTRRSLKRGFSPALGALLQDHVRQFYSFVLSQPPAAAGEGLLCKSANRVLFLFITFD